jgi:hypothetical protein
MRMRLISRHSWTGCMRMRAGLVAAWPLCSCAGFGMFTDDKQELAVL